MVDADALTYDPAQDISAITATLKRDMGAGAFQGDNAELTLSAARLAEAMANGMRAFISPVHKNTRFLIHQGKLTTVDLASGLPALPGVPYPNGVEARRIGDVFIQFTGGICILDPSQEEYEVQLAWAEANPSVCRDATIPETDIWASMKEGQLDLKDKEAGMDKSIDIDAVLRGDRDAWGKSGSLASRARGILAGEASR